MGLTGQNNTDDLSLTHTVVIGLLEFASRNVSSSHTNWDILGLEWLTFSNESDCEGYLANTFSRNQVLGVFRKPCKNWRQWRGFLQYLLLMLDPKEVHHYLTECLRGLSQRGSFSQRPRSRLVKRLQNMGAFARDFGNSAHSFFIGWSEMAGNATLAMGYKVFGKAFKESLGTKG